MHTSWTDLYNSEEELIQDMLKTNSDPDTVPYFQLVKGYEYIDSFKRYYRKHGRLTDRQMSPSVLLLWIVHHRMSLKRWKEYWRQSCHHL